MKIPSRRKLAYLLETNVIESEFITVDGKIAVSTIVHNKHKDSFYKIIWGEVLDGKEKHIWFNQNAEEVKIAPNGEWLTKVEMRDYLESLQMKGSPSPLSGPTLMRVKTVDNIASVNKYVSTMIIEGKSVLYISIEDDEDVVSKELLKTLVRNSSNENHNASLEDCSFHDLSESVRLISQVEIVHEPLLDTCRIEDIMRNNVNLDLIVIDHLKLNGDNESLIQDICKNIDELAQDLNCSVVIGTL